MYRRCALVMCCIGPLADSRYTQDNVGRVEPAELVHQASLRSVEDTLEWELRMWSVVANKASAQVAWNWPSMELESLWVHASLGLG